LISIFLSLTKIFTQVFRNFVSLRDPFFTIACLYSIHKHLPWPYLYCHYFRSWNCIRKCLFLGGDSPPPNGTGPPHSRGF